MVQQLSEAASTFSETVLVSPYDDIPLQKVNNDVPHDPFKCFDDMGGEADWSVFFWFGSTALLVDRGDDLLFVELWDNCSFKGLLPYVENGFRYCVATSLQDNSWNIIWATG